MENLNGKEKDAGSENKCSEGETEKSDSMQLKLDSNINSNRAEGESSSIKSKTTDLGNGSEVVYFPRFLAYEDAWKYFEYLNNHIPWTRPTIHVFGRSCLQPRDSCYVASEGVSKLKYSGYQPHAYSWHQFPPLNHLLRAVEEAIPGSRFNSLLLNRYNGGNDYVAWHSDDDALYGPTPLIASLSFGCERHFFLKKKPSKSASKMNSSDEPPSKRLKKTEKADQQHSFLLKNGSLLVMKGYTQRDWIHSVPKRTKLDAVRINLTFRLVL